MSFIKKCADFVSNIRPYWHSVYYAFNRVDRQRLAEVGPDRTCAEWILRNGGAITFTDRPQILVTNYNALPGEASYDRQLRLHSILAEDVELIGLGFEHLRGCKHLRRISLVKCHRLKNDALDHLHLVRQSLHELEIRRCMNISDEALLKLGVLQNLKKLSLSDLPSVTNLDMVLSTLQTQLPQCEVMHSQ